jgi:hypothetical protein
MAMCVASASPYTTPASEPFVNYLYQQQDASGAVCTGQAAYVSSLSSSLATGVCSPIITPSGAFTNASWGSITVSSPCQSSGASGNLSFTIYNTSTSCTGTVTATATNASLGSCVNIGGINFLPNSSAACPQPSDAGAAAAGLSGGAIAGIVIAVLVVVGGVAAVLLMGGVSSSRFRPKALIGGGASTKISAVVVEKPSVL